MAEKGKKDKIVHAESLLRSARDAGCEIVGLQETHRTGQTYFQASGYTVLCSGEEKKGLHGVGLAVANSIVSNKGCTPELINERMMKMWMNLTGKSNSVSVIVAYAPTETAPLADEVPFWT